jgi:hypothetical protein
VAFLRGVLTWDTPVNSSSDESQACDEHSTSRRIHAVVHPSRFDHNELDGGRARVLSTSLVPSWRHHQHLVTSTKYRVTYDSRGGDNPNKFCVHKENGDQRKFKQSRRGLYYLDTAEPENHTVLTVSTVESNKSKYADRDYTRAKLARKTQILVGQPELKYFIRFIESNSLPNCPITAQDAINAQAIFGRDIGSLKGKTTRRTLAGIRANIINIPKEIMEQYRSITLCIDIMFVNKIPFFMSISRNIRFIKINKFLVITLRCLW